MLNLLLNKSQKSNMKIRYEEIPRKEFRQRDTTIGPRMLREKSRERLLQVEQMIATSIRNRPRQPDIQAELSFFHL